MHRLIFIFLLFMGLNSSGQIIISGKVVDQSKKPLPGISLSLQNSYDGGTSDSLGRYQFSTSEKGKQVFVVTGIGFETFIDTIYIGDQSIAKDVVLHPKPSRLDAVIINAGTFEAGDKNKSAELSTLDVVTTASANADVTSAIKTLPGSQQVGEKEGLFVRGGTGDETKIFIDGTLVNNFFYSSEPGKATRGRFNPFLFTGVVFSSGGYSALYGQAMSSILLLESIDLPEKTSATLGVSYLGGSAGIQTLTRNKKSSWGVTYSYTDLSLAYQVVKQKMDYFTVPKVHELDGNFRIKTKRGMIKYYTYLSAEKLGYRYADIDSSRLKNAFYISNFNMYHNLSWKEKFGDGWKFQLGGSYSTNHDNIKNHLEDSMNHQVEETGNPIYDFKTFSVKNNGRYFNARWVLEKNLGGLSAIRFGNEFNHRNDLMEYTSYDEKDTESAINENLLASYVEADIYLMPKLAMRTGVRSEHSSLLSMWNIAPRFSLSYQFPDRSQMSFAYGRFYQDPDKQYLPSPDVLHFQNATHYILQYQKIANSRILRIEAYYKKYDDLIKASGFNNNQLTAINNKGYGDARGIELFWRDKKSIKNWDYWVSYSYLNTKRDFLNYPLAIRPPFAARHTASLVLKSFIPSAKMQVNASYTFASGRPYYDIYFDYPNSKYTIRQQGQTKDYNDMSLSVVYLPDVGKKDAKSFSIFILSVTNLFGFNNVYSYDFSANGKRMQAVLPPAKRFLYLGWVVSFGIDRSQDIIDSQL